MQQADFYVNEFGGFECECGNVPSDEGFAPCDETGMEVVPELDSDWNGLYVCWRCGKVGKAREDL